MYKLLVPKHLTCEELLAKFRPLEDGARAYAGNCLLEPEMLFSDVEKRHGSTDGIVYIHIHNDEKDNDDNDSHDDNDDYSEEELVDVDEEEKANDPLMYTRIRNIDGFSARS